MSERDRLFHPLTGTLAGIAFLLMATALAQQGTKRDSAHQNPSIQTSQTDKIAERRPPPTGKVKPPDREAKPGRAEWRNEEDLKAQQDMAFWAMLMFVSTTAGVFYVAMTLREAQRSNATADTQTTAMKEQMDRSWLAAKKQAQAYLVPKRLFLSFTDSPDRPMRMSLRLEVENIGSAPSAGVIADFKIVMQFVRPAGTVESRLCIEATASSGATPQNGKGRPNHIFLSGVPVTLSADQTSRGPNYPKPTPVVIASHQPRVGEHLKMLSIAVTLQFDNFFDESYERSAPVQFLLRTRNGLTAALPGSVPVELEAFAVAPVASNARRVD